MAVPVGEKALIWGKSIHAACVAPGPRPLSRDPQAVYSQELAGGHPRGHQGFMELPPQRGRWLSLAGVGEAAPLEGVHRQEHFQ